jgi:hypothetical protein
MALKPRRLAAACCRVDVINGGDGRDTDSFVSTSAILNAAR